MKILGYIVMEASEDYEQMLGLALDAEFPPGGVLTWAGKEYRRAVFATRKDARAAIERTEHYRLACGGNDESTERPYCRIEPVVFIDPAPDGATPAGQMKKDKP